MEEIRDDERIFRTNIQGGSLSAHLRHVTQQANQIPIERDKQPSEHIQPPSLPIQLTNYLNTPQHLPQHQRILYPERYHHQQEVTAQIQQQQKQVERVSTGASMTPINVAAVSEALNANTPQNSTHILISKAAVGSAVQLTEQAKQKTGQQELGDKKSSKDPPTAKISKNSNEKEVTNQQTVVKTTAATAADTTEAVICKKAPKRPRAKPGFGLRTSRTTIVETGQKRRSCICTNSKLCNELMTKWAKVSPPDYHYVQLPREHNPGPPSDHSTVGSESQNIGGGMVPGKTTNTAMSGRGEAPHGNENNSSNNNTNISDTDLYKNGFRYATLRSIKAKNPLPKDERVALCHYHPEVRPYLFWPKNTPSAQKYAIPMSLAVQLGYDTVANKCRGFNTEKYCYAVPTYSFEEAKKEIGSVEEAFYERVRQIKTNPTQFVRDLRQCEEELKEVHKLRKRNAELLRRLDDRRRSIKRLKSVLKVQRHATKEAQQQQLVAQAVSANAQAHAAANSNTVQQQYQQHAYQQTSAFHQQQLVEQAQQQQQQTATIPQPLGQQTHNQFFQPPPPSQEQQAIGIVVGGLAQNSDQHEQQHHWTYTQYSANAIGVAAAVESEQQHAQQQVHLAAMQAYDSAHQHEQQHQQQPVPSPMDDHNNAGTSYTYAQQLEAAMAAAVAAGFKDDQEDVEHHQHHGDIVGDVVDLDGLDHEDGSAEHGNDDDFEDDDWSDTEQYRQSSGGAMSQNHQRPRKWPRKTVILPPASSEMEEIPKKTKRKSKGKGGNNKKKVKVTKLVAPKTKKNDDAASASGVVAPPSMMPRKKDQLPSSPSEVDKIHKV